MEARKENVVLDAVPEEEKQPISNLVMIKNEITVDSDCEVGNNIKIKEEDLVLDVGLQIQDDFPSPYSLKTKNDGDECEMVSEIEIKEEPWWHEGTSPEVKCQLKALPVSELEMCCEIKDETNEDLLAAESTRLHIETASNTCAATTYLFTAADLEERTSFRDGKKIPEFASTNTHAVYENDTIEVPSIERTVHYHKPKAPQEYTNNENLNKHSKSTKNIHVCEISKKKQNNSKTHLRHHESTGPCKYVSENNYTCSGHLKIHGLIHNGKIPYKCEVCEKSFTRMEGLKRHILIHQGERPYKCNVCEKGFTQIGGLKNHILVHEGRRPYKCDVCEKNFTQMGHLKSHILVHEGKRPYKCEVCEKSFARMGGLRIHTVSHTSKSPHKCNVCEKSFTQISDLKRHILIHEGKRPYKCEVCEKSFTQIGTLKSHVLIHGGKRPYKCEVCEKSFTQIGTLKRHIVIHEGKRPYKCEVCEKCFTRMEALRSHILIHKGKKP